MYILGLINKYTGQCLSNNITGFDLFWYSFSISGHVLVKELAFSQLISPIFIEKKSINTIRSCRTSTLQTVQKKDFSIFSYTYTLLQ